MSLINQMLKDLEARRNKQQLNRDLLLNIHAAHPFSKNLSSKPVIYSIACFSLFLFFSFIYFHHSSKSLLSSEATDVGVSDSSVPSSDTQSLSTPAPIQLENINISTDNDTTLLTLHFSQPIWYSLQDEYPENRIVLTLDNLSLSKLCKDNPDIQNCIATLFPTDRDDFIAKVTSLPNENRQYTMSITLLGNNGLQALTYDEVSSRMTLTFAQRPQSALLNTQNTIIKRTKIESDPMQTSYERALELIQKNQLSAGITQLEMLLAKNPKFKDARITLASLFIELKRDNDAMQLIQEGKRLHARDESFIMLEARLMLEQNNTLGAQKLLQSFAPSFKNHLDYYALLAATYERNHEPSSAIALYEKLLMHNSNEASWWLGLAMAKESIGEKNAALEAYRRALSFQQLSPNVQGYILNRIHTLGE